MNNTKQGDLFQRDKDRQWLVSSNAGRMLRDEGIKRVIENSETWQDRALRIIQAAQFDQVTGEELREPVVLAIGEPHHPNAWGALINTAVKRGLIVKTGQYTQMRRASAHARVNAIYRKPTRQEAGND